MKYAVYIAAAAVIGLLIGFVALAIDWLRKNVMHSIRTKTLGLLDTYDDLLEEKSRELSRLEREIREKSADAKAREAEETDGLESAVTAIETAPTAILKAAERASTAAYRDGTVGSLYRAIRANFSFRLDDVLSAVEWNIENSGGPAGRLLDELDYDAVFQMSTLPEEQQLELLLETLDQNGSALLENYLTVHKSFQILTFYDYLKAAAEEEHQPVRIWVPEGIGARNSGAAEIFQDAEICEGFQVEIDHLLYDYSIRARELN